MSAPGTHPSAAQPLLDRRRSHRKPHLAQAFIASPTATNPAERIEVATLNLSRHGVAFELARPVPEHTFYNIEIAMGDQRLLSEIKIISCQKTDHGAWQIGAEFC